MFAVISSNAPAASTPFHPPPLLALHLLPTHHAAHSSQVCARRCSQVPDIYDCAKHDACHNAHLELGSVLEELYAEAKVLADAVIPNE